MLVALNFALKKGFVMLRLNLLQNFLFTLFLMSAPLYSWQNITGGRGDFVTDSTFHLLYGGVGTVVLGDMNATGDSILRVDDGSTPNLISSHTAYKDVDPAFHNATYSLNDAEKMNSSSAVLHLPPYVQGKDIVWAGLFWQGHIYRENGTYTDAQVDTAAANWNSVTLKDANGAMHTLTAPLNNNNLTHKAFHYAMHDNSGFRYQYGAYYDVTSIIKNSYSPVNNTFTVGNIKTTAGQDNGGFQYIAQAPAYSGSFRFGLYGGWALIVVYDVDGTTATTNNVPAKNITIYDGFDLYLTWGNGTVPFTTTLNLAGFYTPKSGAVDSKLLLFGGAGDRGIEDDTLQLQDKKNTGTFLDLSNTPNLAGKQFNHTYTYFGQHMTPTSTNKQGMDLDIYDVSDKMDNAQSSTQIKFGVVKKNSHCDQIFPEVIAFSTKLYEPVFCYDYAYQQQKVYFTEDNDGTHDPKIVGDVIPGEDVNVTIFIRNLVDSDLQVKNMTVNITDINTTQASYLTDSTYLTKTGELYPTNLTDSTLTVGSNFIKDIPVGDMASNDYFYLYYGLNPKQNSLDMPIKVTATYDLIVNSTTSIPYVLRVGSNLNMCSSTNFKYTPQKGLFNIVSDTFNAIYPRSGGGYYNNLPTAVTQKADDYTLVAYDANDTSLNTPADANVSVEVELIDASAFHDTFASCQEPTSSISDKITVTFKNSSLTSFTSQDIINSILTANGTGYDGNAAKKFYQTARENAAFRISWNTDKNDSTITTITDSTNPNLYHLENFSDYATENCVMPVTTDVETSPGHFVTQTYTQVPQACFNAGTSSASSMNDKELAACMQCIYGKNLHYVCSRDNFSIRPEAFNVQIDDQNQSNPSVQTDITTLADSGSTGAVAHPLDLAADYKYNIEINATNHYGNDASPGYTKTMNVTAADTAQYIWEPRSAITAGACNDENNKSITMRFVDGAVDRNTSVTQVGEYRLNLKDTTWTTVDSNPFFMTHHNGDSYFMSSGTPDCTPSSTVVPTVGTAALNGCNISSSHLNNHYETVSGVLSIKYLQYNDYNVTFHPYTFSINNIFTIGPSKIAPPATLPYVYMTDINTSVHEQMAVHLDTNITAVGKNSTTALSNFVAGCFEKPLDISIDKSPTKNTALAYNFRFHDFNSSNALQSTQDINGSIAAGNVNDDANLTTKLGTFFKDLNGKSITQTNLNYSRVKNVAVNPEEITFISYKVHNGDTFSADLITNHTADGNVSLGNQKIVHYYGRTNAPKVTITCKTSPCYTNYDPNPANNPDNTRVYVYDEVYCYQTTNGNTCDTNLLPAGTSNSNDIRWWINKNEDQNVPAGTDGIIGTVAESTATNVTEVSQSMIYKYQYETVLKYSGTVFPYSANMKNNATDWLIYDATNPSATANKFQVDFVQEAGWNGVHETNTTTNTRGAAKTNRRVLW